MLTSFEVLTDEEFEALRTNAIKVNYWVVCHPKVWLYAKGLRMEPLSDRVALEGFCMSGLIPICQEGNCSLMT